MKKQAIYLLSAILMGSFIGCNESYSTHEKDLNQEYEYEKSEKPIQHMKLEEIVSLEKAISVFNETTASIKSKVKLDADELHEIHIITYSLEKSIAYFSENMDGEKQSLAKEIAEVVESIHLASENNRSTEAKSHLENYFKLSDKFSTLL